ncbi:MULTISPECIES: MarR family winged helix-turn-helix transcriptional regulator [Rhizobium]|jgi:DNA-binding MarR family transcriptional regulator|uniref:MarR family transcriptional regulator n=1 Tax=Rhizobium tropici TaxID=398 RepID=A0A6P1C248_RHITR|nr:MULTISPECIES: MarR family transcriptional regulator [Rhizobium]AGB71225.1 transcriptional regulator, MarR family [Rhizobium tropici CIAT 899]MBB3382309.1 DNA-binding MarR family transcriptional regulator [Rhizobium sp. BK098]MBB3566247.1 DNA-binding MarR family transcriptional regulator [Rhizobium sp. BK491]MBB3614011.1 DNA-binding MarR family transcriptional regulator [Rhizobium sp. BK609]MBB3679669.1 DNA-binding MarR family transcriptional regulator [Rhizobium sp. BK612]
MSSTPTLGFLLHDVARLLRKRFEQRAKDLGLTRSQWQTLAYLANNEGIHQAGLAEMLEIEPITLVRILDKLSERGLVERRQHPNDRRSWLLYMRDEARPLMDTMRGMGDLTRREALEGASQEDQERLYELLILMKSNLISACRSKAVDKELQHG